eukprot:TRINITY_DN4893_c0_g1_i1.p2 TRINITY_DN4893_c0_g1~~TRINITY_DN4893_c0_g1_i1.p2  ORF type:complete len:104 (-),score=35.31 TRINITY_DN4893_c0_g1_i1:128-439(-)
MEHSEHMLPNKTPVEYVTGERMEENEIKARMMRVLSSFEKFDLKKLNWEGDFAKDHKLDSLEQVALVVSLEEEFLIVFEDRVFESFKSLQDVLNELKERVTLI